MSGRITTKKFRTLDEQVELLELERKLKINNTNLAKKHLMDKNYFDLINGFETMLLIDTRNKRDGYITKDFNDFVILYEFDKKIANRILSSIATFENKLPKHLILHVLHNLQFH